MQYNEAVADIIAVIIIKLLILSRFAWLHKLVEQHDVLSIIYLGFVLSME